MISQNSISYGEFSSDGTLTYSLLEWKMSGQFYAIFHGRSRWNTYSGGIFPAGKMADADMYFYQYGKLRYGAGMRVQLFNGLANAISDLWNGINALEGWVKKL